MSFSLWLAIALAAGPDSIPPLNPPAIGASVQDVSLTDIQRRTLSLGKFRDQRALVVIFTGTECPLANRYVPSLIELHGQYAEQGVQFLIINSNSQDTFIDVSAHAQEREIPFPVIKDFDHRVADAFGATRTPEAFLLSPDRVIRYHGRIDDQYSVGAARPRPLRQDLKEALDELLADQPIRVSRTEFDGCIIGRRRPTARADQLTFSKDVAKIIQSRCQACHRPGQIGPMPLTNYDDVKAWSDTIREVVLEQRMPPWHADPRYGEFSNERTLELSERETLVSWIDGGCSPGDERDLPPPMSFPGGWTIGQPDVVFEMPVEFDVPESGVIDYQRFTVDPGFKEDVWVQAAECRPGNLAVVHHVLVYIREPGRPIYSPDGTAMSLVGWAPGDMPAIFPTGIARRIPAGAKLVFEVHYTPNGTAQKDRSSVGIIFAKEPPEHPVVTNILANMGLRVPPHAARHREEMNFTFPRDAQVLSFMPHMHLRGSSAKYVATYPDGREETLLYVPQYDFNWQSIYRFEKPLRIPKGTKLRWISWWDNSAANPRNPDPSQEVRWGEQTWDEMQNGWMDLIWLP